MNASLNRQDASGRMPLAVCLDGRVLARVRPGSDAAACLGEVAAERGIDPGHLEILQVCVKHPETSAVDCVICEPVDEDAETSGSEVGAS
jgi:hypothetical protein